MFVTSSGEIIFELGMFFLYLFTTSEVSKIEVPRDVRNSESGKKTSSGEIGINIRTHASPKVGLDQVSGGVSVLCWHATPIANILWKPCTIR